MADEVDHRRRGARYRARKRAVSLLFEAELRDADVVELAEERRRMGEESQEFHDVAPYTMQIVTGVAERLDRLDSTISEHLREWTLARLPAVDLLVQHTDPGLQGDRSTGGTKPATLETGAEVQVPLFINTGDKLRIDTRDGHYLSRVND